MTLRARFSPILLLAMLLCSACGGSRQRVLLDPVVDLAPHSRIGLVTLSAEGTEGALPAFATRRLGERLLRAQQGIEILELGEVAGPIDAAMARRLGEQFGVRTLLVGHLVVSDIKPRAFVVGGARVSAEVSLSLATRLMSAESGAMVWSQSSRVRETLAAVAVVGSRAVVTAKDAEDTYGDLVDRLVWDVTQDFRGTWVRQ